MKDNPAFISEFIDICWVDPWSDNPAMPAIIKDKYWRTKAKEEKRVEQLNINKKKNLEKKNMNAIDDILDNHEPKPITNF